MMKQITPNAYRGLRLEMGLTQPQLARILGTSKETILRREKSLVPISGEAELAIMALAGFELAYREEKTT